MFGRPSKVTNTAWKLIFNHRNGVLGFWGNEWYLPRFKTSMITELYLRNVLTGKTYCPKFSDVKLRPCPRPPSKEVLLKKFLKIVAEHSW